MTKRTCLHEHHLALGARMVEFAGWLMPVQYSGIVRETEAVRRTCGLFDVSHMGRIHVRGSEAAASLQWLLTSDVVALWPGRAAYSLMCNERGGVLDDLLVYRLADDEWMLVVNASRAQADVAWIAEEVGSRCRVEDTSEATGMVALQGPEAERLLERLTEADLLAMRRNEHAQCQVAGVSCLVSRTGYTGEDGFEIIAPSADAGTLWESLLSEGKEVGLAPCGLGARDVCRLEAGLPLYGHELDEGTTPLEAGLGWAVKSEGKDFIGRAALAAQHERGPERTLIGLALLERGVPRSGCAVVKESRNIGRVTSGTFSPTLRRGIALAYTAPGELQVGDTATIAIRQALVPAAIVERRFYRREEGSGAR